MNEVQRTLLRALVDLRDRQIQKARIQFSNRLDALDREADNPGDSRQREVLQRWADRFGELEAELDAEINELVKELAESVPLFEHVLALKGIGPMLAAKLLAPIEIERAETVSALWRYAGMGVVDGKAERPVKGEKLHYNKRLKTTVWLVATSFMKAGSPYRNIYDDARAFYDVGRDWTPLQCHRAATRKMMKVFLAHLWDRWRTLEGLPTRSPYVHERLGHTHRYSPTDFGWPELGGD